MSQREKLTLKPKPKTTPTAVEPVAEATPVKAVATVSATLEKIEQPIEQIEQATPTPNTPKKPKQFVAEFDYIRQLATAYPHTFFMQGDQRKPLMIGIADSILAAQQPPLDKDQLQSALKTYCRSQSYLKATLTETHRIDLNGQPVAEISRADKANAELHLAYQEQHSKTAPVTAKAKPTTIKTKTNTNKENTMTNTPTATGAAQATARAAKITLVLDAHSLTRIDSTGQKQTQLIIHVSEMTFITELSSKTYRKALASLDELGADNCVMILQGTMPTFGKLEGAGLVVQAKKAKE